MEYKIDYDVRMGIIINPYFTTEKYEDYDGERWIILND